MIQYLDVYTFHIIWKIIQRAFQGYIICIILSYMERERTNQSSSSKWVVLRLWHHSPSWHVNNTPSLCKNLIPNTKLVETGLANAQLIGGVWPILVSREWDTHAAFPTYILSTVYVGWLKILSSFMLLIKNDFLSI